MKQLYILLFIIISIISCVSSTTSSSCFSNGYKIKGFTMEFISSSFNGNFKTSNNEIKQLSFYAAGLTSIDYQNNQLFLQYRLNEGGDNWVSGQIFAFKNNGTKYILDNLVNGTCYIEEFMDDYIVESFPEVQKVSQGTMGYTNVEFLQIIPSSTNSSTTNTIIVNSNGDGKCGLMSLNSHNNINYPTGFVLSTFYNYIDEPDQSLFNLPSQCWNLSNKNGKSNQKKEHSKNDDHIFQNLIFGN